MIKLFLTSAIALVGTLASAQECFDSRSEPTRLEYWGFDLIQRNPLTRDGGQFSVMLDRNLNVMNLDMAPANEQPLIELIKVKHYHVSRWKRFYTFRSTCHFWEDPNLLFADLLQILVSQNFAVACRFDDEPAVDSESSIKRLWARREKITLLTCMYRPKAAAK